MKKALYFLITIIFFSCKKEVKNRKFFIKEFNWAIEVPEGLNYVSTGDIKKLKAKGMKLLENTYGDEVEDKTRTLFFIESGKFNKFEANTQFFDESVDGSYTETNNEIKKLLVNTFSQNMSNIKIDSLSSKVIIDNLEFFKFDLKVTFPNELVLYTAMFNRLFDKKELSCSIIYSNKEIGTKMLKSFTCSKFK